MLFSCCLACSVTQQQSNHIDHTDTRGQTESLKSEERWAVIRYLLSLLSTETHYDFARSCYPCKRVLCFRVQHIFFGRKRDEAPATESYALPTPVSVTIKVGSRGGGREDECTSVLCLLPIISRGQCGMLKLYKKPGKTPPKQLSVFTSLQTAAGKWNSQLFPLPGASGVTKK